jgi:hypothetical protein
MVNTMVARRVQQPLDYSRQFAHRFGVDPELEDGIQLMHSSIPAKRVRRGFSTQEEGAKHMEGGNSRARGR